MSQTKVPDAMTAIASGAQGASMVYLGSVAASNQAAVSFGSSLINSTYDEYYIEWDSVVPVTNATEMQVVLSANNGGALLNSNNYFAGHWTTSAAGGGDAGGANAAAMDLNLGISTINTAGFGHTGHLRLSNVNSAGTKNILAHDCAWGSTTQSLNMTMSGGNTGTSAVNYLQFQMSSGNVSSGNFRLYGVRKS